MINDGATTSSGAPASGSATGTSKKGGNCWSRVHGKINHVADNFFYRLGYWVATHPKATLTISLALVIACCFGFANFEVESDGEDLWVPSDSLSKDQESIVKASFDDSSEYALFLVEAPEGESVLTKERMDAIWELDAKVLAIEVKPLFPLRVICVTKSYRSWFM